MTGPKAVSRRLVYRGSEKVSPFRTPGVAVPPTSWTFCDAVAGAMLMSVVLVSWRVRLSR